MLFNTITVSDGISMGTEGMKYSLVSREVIADSIETVVAGQGFDAVVALGGCDKNMPGCLIALARLDRPAIFVYGGSILPGKTPQEDGCEAKNTDVVSVFEAVGANAQGKITPEQFLTVEQTAIPGAGSCGGMYTANTMATAIEAMGMSLPGSSSQIAVSMEKAEDCTRAGQAVVELLRLGITPRQIMTQEGVRERHHRDHHPGRLDQRRAAPAGHGARRGGQAVDRRLHPHRQAACRCSPTCARAASTTPPTCRASAASSR